MPIETDSGNIDFVWRFSPSSDGQEPISYPLRLHKTKEFGPTLSFLDEENKPVFSLPADFVREVEDYIAQYREGTKPSLPKARVVQGVGPSIQPPKIGGKPVPVPISNRNPPNPKDPNGRPGSALSSEERAKLTAMNIDMDDETPVEGVYLPPGHEITEADLDPNAPVFQTFTNTQIPETSAATPSLTTPPLNEAEILAERDRARNNPNKKPGIKRRTE